MKASPGNHPDGVINEDLLKQLAYNEKMAELGRISAGIVHEVNAPLSVISSAAQMIMRETDISEFVREMVSRINSEAQRLSQLTRGLLSFSRQDEATGETDINLAVDFVLDFLSYEAAKRAVTILRTLDHKLPLITLDNNQLKQILFNIIMNAMQAMESTGGKLLIETIGRNEGEISIVISDNGPGIAEDVLKKIFLPYFTTKKPGEGTGLGLYVTKTLVENMGGSIEVESNRGEGTTFVVTFLIIE